MVRSTVNNKFNTPVKLLHRTDERVTRVHNSSRFMLMIVLFKGRY